VHIDLRGGEVQVQHAHRVCALPGNGEQATTAARAAEVSNATLRVVLDASTAPAVPLGCAGAISKSGSAALAITTGGIRPRVARTA
jgi:hypothetical protein